MALEQLKKDRKKNPLWYYCRWRPVYRCFYCLTTMISSQGERTVLPNYWNADFTIQNQTQTTEEIHSLRPVIEESLLEEIENMDGVKDIHVTEGVPVCFPYEPEGFSDLWIRNYIERTPYLSAEEVIADYQADPSRYYGMLKGIDEEEFDYLNQSLDTPVDKQDFLDGKTGIVKYDGSEIPEECLNQLVSFRYQDQSCAITIGAVSYESYYSGRNTGATLIVSQEYLKEAERPAGGSQCEYPIMRKGMMKPWRQSECLAD